MLDSASLLAHSQDLDLIVRHVLAGLGHGLHAGRERGAGVEFSEYRAYAPGDEWRRVDWKLLARNDRYYVREAERDSHVAIWLWLDASASMAEPSYQIPGITKLDFARVFFACLAAVAQRQGDAFGLLIAQQGRLQITPAARGPRQFHRVMAQLKQTDPAGILPDAALLKTQLQTQLHFARAPSLIFAISDFLEWPSACSESLVRLRHMQHDVRALCLQTKAECEASFPSDTAYVDPEHHANPVKFSDNAKAEFLAAHTAHFRRVEQQCRQVNIPFLRACIEQDVGKTLRDWLKLAGRA